MKSALLNRKIRQITASLILILSFQYSSIGQVIMFQSTYGTVNGAEYGKFAIENAAGGYGIAGFKNGGAGGLDVYFLEVDSCANSLSSKRIGAGNSERSFKLVQNRNNHYVMAGMTNTWGVGGVDGYMCRINNPVGLFSGGAAVGSTQADEFFDFVETPDTGYVAVGRTMGYGAGGDDVYVVKFDFNFNVLWSRTVGGLADDRGYGIDLTLDGGFIITGSTRGFGAAGLPDIYMVRLDAAGNLMWTKRYGQAGLQQGRSVVQASDSGYVITGTYESNHWGLGINQQLFVMKTDYYGALQWIVLCGDQNDDVGEHIIEHIPGEYVVAGWSNSFGTGVADYDGLMVRVDYAGNVIGSMCYGGNQEDRLFSVSHTRDGGMTMTGHTFSFGAGNADVYMLKTDAGGNTGCNEWPPALQTVNPNPGVGQGGAQNSGHQRVAATFMQNRQRIDSILCENCGANKTSQTQGLIAEGQERKEALNLFPNPTNERLTVSLDVEEHTTVQIEILDLAGRVVIIDLIEDINYNRIDHEISVSKLSEGFYILKATTSDGETLTRKFAVSK